MAAIQIKLGDENRIFIEPNVLNSPLFAEQYAQLINKLTEYVRAEKEDGESNSNNFNNLFLINGERGAGKSSMLTSLHGYLKKKDAIDDKKFLRLKVVDPSSFTNNANILQIIIAELFKEFKKDTLERQISYEEKNEITKIFVQIKHALCVLDSPTISAADDSDIESLVDLSNAIVLEELIDKLICKILKARDEDMLLVCVDDIDLNTAHAYEMLEQIRKYLILPNVIVLIAAKMSQLQDVVQQYFLTEYRPLVSTGAMSLLEVQEMSNKYLLKLLPLEHRIDLNSALDKFNQSIEILRGDDVIETANNGDELIYKLIYQKTGLQYLLERDGANYIVPDNLRAFRFLVRLLCDMDAAKKDKNIDSYQQYFLSEWIPQNLQKDEQNNIQALLKISDVSKVNKLIIQNIADKINFIEYPQEMATLVDVRNVYSNLSLGDVMAVLIWGKRVVGSEQFAKYIYAIKHAYTILLEKAYREMLQEEDMLKKINMYSSQDNEEYINTYQRLVGGAFLNGYTWDYLMPPINNNENRLHRVITINMPNQPQLSGALMMSLIVTPYRSKSINEGEGYRKQMPIYYQQPFYLSHKQVIIDWFYPLYSIPFGAEQLSRFGAEELKPDLMRTLQTKGNTDTETYKAFMETAIHSVDLLEKIYWHIRAKRGYLRSETPKSEIYVKLYKTIGEVKFDDYISLDDRMAFERLVRAISVYIDKDKEKIAQFIENENKQAVPTKPIKYPFDSTLKRCKTVSDLKERMRAINVRKGYNAERLDSEIDKLGFTDTDIQSLDPYIIRNRLKQIKM